jgi:hypothetical protein
MRIRADVNRTIARMPALSRTFMARTWVLLMALSQMPFLMSCRSADKASQAAVAGVSASAVKDSKPAPPTKETCYFRQKPPAGKPVDYHLWQGERDCKAKSCAPARPGMDISKEEIRSFEADGAKPQLASLSATKEDLIPILRRAKKEGHIVRMGPDYQEVYDLLREEVKSAPPGADVHFVFGFNHMVVGQTPFFNRLLKEWPDAETAKYHCYLVLEMPRIAPGGEDIQAIFDHYLVKGNEDTWPQLLFANKWQGIDAPVESKEEVAARNEMLKIASRNCYNIVSADLSRSFFWPEIKRLDHDLWRSARAVYAARSVRQRENPQEAEVFFWRYGKLHARKQDLPFYINKIFSRARVRSILINGGTYIAALGLDQAFRELGWENQTFVWYLPPGYEADVVIHVPTQGKKLDWSPKGQGKN